MELEEDSTICHIDNSSQKRYKVTQDGAFQLHWVDFGIFQQNSSEEKKLAVVFENIDIERSIAFTFKGNLWMLLSPKPTGQQLFQISLDH